MTNPLNDAGLRDVHAAALYPRMENRAMARKLSTGEALDVRREGTLTDTPGKYLLRRFVEDVDYCDAVAEFWIWSVGRRRSDGAIVASTGSDLYQNPEYECLFLR